MDDFNHYIYEMVSGDTYSKMGGILAIVALMNADVCNTGTRISRSVPWKNGQMDRVRKMD